MAETLFAFTNDDPGGESPELFAELLDFLAEEDVPATFFVIPNAGDRPLDDKPEWLALLHRALEEGHELQLHGFVHHAFEFGVPPGFMLDIMPENKARWQKDPAPITAEHTVQILTDKLARGREIFDSALGLEPQGFRSGCLAICDNMYTALADLDFDWSSNTVVNPMGWRYINRDYDAGESWQSDVSPRPFRHQSGLIEAPMLSEYTWYLEDDDVDKHYELARSDYDRTRQETGTFVALSHYYAMTGKWSAGLDVYRRLFAHAREQGDVQFVTLGQLLASQTIQAGQ